VSCTEPDIDLPVSLYELQAPPYNDTRARIQYDTILGNLSKKMF